MPEGIKVVVAYVNLRTAAYRPIFFPLLLFLLRDEMFQKCRIVPRIAGRERISRTVLLSSWMRRTESYEKICKLDIELQEEICSANKKSCIDQIRLRPNEPNSPSSYLIPLSQSNNICDNSEKIKGQRDKQT
ncbi:unnamed protein product [Brugia pahangi]|uniref:Uncharacterized protein n=1 Tax=Brugia pahangi TaxID=6280 RepID=A0A0N4SYN5_BRUPA|nr:unnamed protein product [Brugia pahangi]